jgi:hypothetical protein
MRERDLQRQLCDWLRYQHYAVLECGTYRRKTRCPACGRTFFATGGHSAAGVPDLLLHHPGLRGNLLGLELKIPGGRIRTRQGELAAAGAIRIVRSLEDVQQALMECGMPVSIGGLR